MKPGICCLSLALRSLSFALMLMAMAMLPPASFAAAVSEVSDPALVALWHMDGDWNDSSGGGHNGLPNNGVTFSNDAKIGASAGSFDGADDYIRVPNAPALNPANELTVSAWYKPNPFSGSGNDSIVDKGYLSHTAPYYQFHLGASGNQYALYPASFGFSVAAGGTIYGVSTGPNFWTPGNWYNIVGTYDGATVKLYVNGVLLKYIPARGVIADYGKDVHIGRFSNLNAYLPGLLDEVSLYNRALPATEIQELYRKFVVKSPTVNPVTSPTASQTITLSGTKQATTAILVNGTVLVPLDGATTWQANYTLSPGTNDLSVTAKDNRGFQSLPTAITVTVDATPPTGSIVIDNGAALTNSSQVQLFLTAADSYGVAEMRFSQDGVTWTEPESYATARGWFLPSGDGVKRVYARFADSAGNWSDAVSATITLDTTSPAAAASPSGGAYNAAQTVTLSANEAAAIYYTTDGTTPTTGSSLYDRPIPVTDSALVKFFAKDAAGNIGDTKTENYTIDLAPPILTVSTLSDGAYTNNDTLNTAGIVQDSSGVRDLSINGVTVTVNADGSFSHALLLEKGPNTVTVTATDLAGNQTVDTRTIILDQTAPQLTVLTPADSAKTNARLLTVSGTVDKTSRVTISLGDTVQYAAMNDGAFIAPVSLVYGYNTIEVTATDLAGNLSSQKRTVVFDDQKPALSITEPNQDLRTNQRSLAIKGTVFDALTAVTVSVSKEGETFAPPVVDGTFEQSVTFQEEKTYGITVTATNEAGTATAVQRNVIYDSTPPALAINAVISPTNQPDQILSGIREAEAAVAVSCSIATVGAVSYPTGTTWEVRVAGLSEGENVITATSTDAAGNPATASARILLARTPLEVTATATPKVLRHSNHKLVPVTIEGGILAHGIEIQSVAITVEDEYGKYNYRDLKFGDTVLLEAWRDGGDKDGRIYTITATVVDRAGNMGTQATTVVVPHDMSK